MPMWAALSERLSPPGEEFGLRWSGRDRGEYGFGADLGESGTGVAGQVKMVNSLGDAGGSLDLVGKAVPAAEIDGLQQNGPSGGMVTRSREDVGVSDALDDLPLGRGRGAAHSVIGGRPARPLLCQAVRAVGSPAR